MARFYWLLRRYDASLIAPMTLMAPLIGVISGVVLLDDPVSWQLVAGGLIAIAGCGDRGGAPVEEPAAGNRDTKAAMTRLSRPSPNHDERALPVDDAGAALYGHGNGQGRD